MKKRARGILVCNGRVLVVKISKKKGNYFTLPGGHSRKDESLEDTCVREINEETGLKVEVEKQILKTDETNHSTYYFLCSVEDINDTAKDDEGFPVVRVLGEELGRKKKYEVMWLKSEDLKDIAIYPREILSKIQSLIA
ncbi:MAG: NUDIX domain-containing protein [bacterium]